MAKYSNFKYSQAKYGTTTSDLLLWTFIVKWDGVYWDGSNEATRMVDLHITRGRDNVINPSGRGFQGYRPGYAVATFDNEDGRYDPYNTTSPLYPYVTPGKLVSIKVKVDSTGSNYNVMHGIITDIQPYNKGRQRFARITVGDALAWLSDKVVDIYGLHQNLKWEGIANGLRDRVNFPDSAWSQSTINTGQYTIPYSWYSEANVLEAMGELATAELGGFVHDRFGALIHWAADSTHLGTVTIDESELLADISFPQPWEVVRNDIRVMAYPKQLFAVNTVLWDLGEQPLMAYGGKITVLAWDHFSLVSLLVIMS